jgi:hypothetical protein
MVRRALHAYARPQGTLKPSACLPGVGACAQDSALETTRMNETACALDQERTRTHKRVRLNSHECLHECLREIMSERERARETM